VILRLQDERREKQNHQHRDERFSSHLGFWMGLDSVCYHASCTGAHGIRRQQLSRL
jgi:hypothetical protein